MLNRDSYLLEDTGVHKYKVEMPGTVLLAGIDV